MAHIAPFRGIRYDPLRLPGGDLSAVLAPPYDVLGQADRDALVDGHPRNVVAVDLPHMPPGFAGPPEAYARSAELLNAWLADGTLTRDPKPALYVYHQQFTYAGRSITRRMFFARLRLEAFGSGTVFPHEQTFGGPKEDRLMLTRATRCNVSPFFGLYPDARNEVAAVLDVGDREPDAAGRVGELDNKIWLVEEPETIERAVEAMSDRAVFIADGHHRYGTALMYRDELIAQAGSLPDDHPANTLLVVLCPMEDDGLLILPTHRLLKGLDVDRALAALRDADGVDLVASAGNATDPVAPGTFRIYDGRGDSVWEMNLDGPGILARLEPDRSEAWRRLDLAVLHRYLIDDVLRAATPGEGELEIRYIKDAADERRQARESSAILFETAATSLSDLGAVCQAGELMPQKSTFFYPKLATGLLINPLTD